MAAAAAAAAMRRWAARMMPKPSPPPPFPPSIYPTMLHKVEGMKKMGAPTEETSKALGELEERLKICHRFWEANKRQAQGLLRDGVKSHVNIALAIATSSAALVKGYPVAYKFGQA